jgi:hypothetical protein
MRGVALAAVGIALALTACGDDPDDPSFAAEADGICVELAEGELQAYAEHGAGEITVEYLSTTRELRAGALEELAALEPPAEDADGYERYLATLERGLVVFDEAIAAVRERNPDALLEARLASRQTRLDANEIGVGVGLTECAGVLSDGSTAEITATLELSADPDGAEQLCRELATSAFVEGRFDSVDECVEQQSVDAGIESVQVDELQGVEGVSANVLVTLVGRDGATEYEASLAFEDDVWKLNSIAPVASSAG